MLSIEELMRLYRSNKVTVRVEDVEMDFIVIDARNTTPIRSEQINDTTNHVFPGLKSLELVMRSTGAPRKCSK